MSLINYATKLDSKIKSGDLDYYSKVSQEISSLQNLSVPQKDIHLKNGLLRYLEDHSKLTKDYQLYKDFITFVLLAAFKTAETIIHRLADTPVRKLNRRFKYAWTQLKHNPDGTVSHNFIHNVGNVPNEYITTLDENAPKYMGKVGQLGSLAPYFISDITSRAEADSIEDMIRPDTMTEDDTLNDVYRPVRTDMSPCSVHDGLKLRTDCVICKAIIPENDRPVIISKAFMKKINVTENLLKFLAIQQDKRAAQERANSSK